MRLIILACLAALVLSACGESTPGQKSGETAAVEAAMEPTAPALQAPAPTAPPPGDCGDQSALPAEERVANTPKWTLASEQDNFGFDVFRGDSEDGEFVKLTANPIIGAGTTDETQRYEFRDDSIDPCREYWYYIESISTAGAREKFTPTFKASAKRSPRTESANP